MSNQKRDWSKLIGRRVRCYYGHDHGKQVFITTLRSATGRDGLLVVDAPGREPCITLVHPKQVRLLKQKPPKQDDLYFEWKQVEKRKRVDEVWVNLGATPIWYINRQAALSDCPDYATEPAVRFVRARDV